MSLEVNETPELEQVIKSAIRSELMDFKVCLPVRVEKYNKDRQEVDVQPLLKKQYRLNDEVVSLPIIPSVPVNFPSSNGGNSYIVIPIKTGDLGYVVVCDRSIDKWLSGSGQEVLPDDVRIHNLTDAIFIPGLRPFQNPLTIDNENDLFIVNDQFKIQIDPTGKIKAQSSTDELMLILSDLLQVLINALVVTGIGAMPFTNATITLLTSIKTRMDLIRIQ
jgi:hypothetical protein